ncbi:MAG: F0F1 ATP synthase subunit A [Candidatus Gracilibacteria bacterium]|nr:F0F1 ATP synthase subunit A [Candidatus Gracilibacteria bacterium]
MANIPEITLQTVPMLQIGSIGISNSVLATLVVTLLLAGVGAFLIRNLRVVPTRLQVGIEGIIEFFMGQLTSAWGSEERAKKYLPVIFTLFFFLLVANQFSILPLVSSITADGVQALRTPTSDLALPVAMAIAMIGSAHVIAFIAHPLNHLGNYFKFFQFLKVRSFSGFLNTCLEVFLGLLDIIGELAKIVSLSCRLFGNIFAGEVMITVITGLAAFIVPMPFIFLSIFSGVVQAFVFALLSLQFMAMIVKSAEPEAAA